METVQGFHVLQVKFSKKQKCGHYIYMKMHSVKQQNINKKQTGAHTLFILNIPAYCSKESVRHFFQTHCGGVSEVYLEQKPNPRFMEKDEKSQFFDKVVLTGFKVAYVVFESAVALKKALKLDPKEEYCWSTPEHPILIGLKKWKEEYNERILETNKCAEMEKEIEEYMTKYDEKQKEEYVKAKQIEGEPDDKGWITVTRKGRVKGAPRTEKAIQKIEEKEKKKEDVRNLVNFYSFQMKEAKMKQLVDMRKKFEDDKKRINMLKQSRRFKPY